jgi:predicted GNAT superfamily acetyltransferase
MDQTRGSAMTYRLLTTRDECAAVAALEREIWGPDYDEAVPIALLLVSQAHGGILIGAFDREDRLVGFVFSLCGFRNGQTVQWSYKLGVLERYRSEGVGEQLKRRQRERALDMGIDLIEWTFDPMLAANAHLNLGKLGAVLREYREDMYGKSLSPVRHRVIPTDRVVVAWHLRQPRVNRRLLASWSSGSRDARDVRDVRDVLDERDPLAFCADAMPVNHTATDRGPWPECTGIALDSQAGRLLVAIPLGFGDMVTAAPGAAMAWRLAIRRIFTTYLSKGYEAVDFVIDAANQRGVYLLVQPSPRVVDDAPVGSVGAGCGMD